LDILDLNFNKVAHVAEEKEFDVITNVTYADLLPKAGMGYFNWTCPDLPSGRYYLKYSSGWTIWHDEGSFAHLSEPFFILQNRSENTTEFLDTLPIGVRSKILSC
jgi:hypothetical protein